MASASSSRERFLSTTARLMRRRGYAATGLNEIVSRSGAPKGSLYFHFPGGKEQLAAEAMEQAGAGLAVAISAVLDGTPEFGTAVGVLIDAMAAGLEQSSFRDGCPIATVALDAAAESEPVRSAVAAAFESWLGPIAARLEREGFAPAAARRRALLILCSLEGALILARAARDLAPLQAVREELVALAVPDAEASSESAAVRPRSA
ncbi:MAG TPA: helix-turn-helix domain-containing protein [Solirubrobacteraceae bacterium]|jgi:TetR/AcrR family transcriptional repressor of lmrAB and yxaGH operons|nr:helix-turn-helix domain-containing protein [Solirubrobacteraceae bacterium]